MGSTKTVLTTTAIWAPPPSARVGFGPPRPGGDARGVRLQLPHGAHAEGREGPGFRSVSVRSAVGRSDGFMVSYGFGIRFFGGGRTKVTLVLGPWLLKARQKKGFP